DVRIINIAYFINLVAWQFIFGNGHDFSIGGKISRHAKGASAIGFINPTTDNSIIIDGITGSCSSIVVKNSVHILGLGIKKEGSKIKAHAHLGNYILTVGRNIIGGKIVRTGISAIKSFGAFPSPIDTISGLNGRGLLV